MTDQQSVEIVTCSACNALYREPKVLPCLHCYCKECIEKQVVSKENDQVFRCQQCDKDVDLPYNPENLPTANFIHRMVNLHKIAKQADNDDIECGQCHQSTTAPNFCCAGCGFICPSCEQAHKVMAIFECHKVVKREELKRNPEQSLVHSNLSPKTVRCPKHSKALEFYCVTCEKPVCNICVTLEHNVKEHECKTVEECITDCKANLSHQAKKLRTFCDTMLRAVEEAKNQKSQITNLSVNCEEEISRTFENVLQSAIACKQELLDEVQRRTQEKLDVLEVQLKQLQPAASEIQHVAEFTEQCYEHADDAELLSLNDMLLIGIQEAIKRGENNIREPVAQVDFAINVSRCADKVNEVFQQHATVSVVQPEVQVSGDGLSTAKLNETAQFTIHIASPSGPLPTEECTIQVELKSKLNGSTCPAQVATKSKSTYEVTYKPEVRGHHKLHIHIDGNPVPNSPFEIFVECPPHQLSDPICCIKGLETPYGAAFNNKGELLISLVSRKIGVLVKDDKTEHGYSLRRIEFDQPSDSKLAKPTGIATDKDGFTYITDEGGGTSCVKKYDKYWRLQKSVGEEGSERGQFDRPGGIGINQQNKLYVCDRVNERVQVLDSDLNVIHVLENPEFSQPADVAFDGNGNTYITDHFKHQVFKFNLAGELVDRIGRPGSGPGELKSPRGIVIHRDFIYVTERDNKRVSIFNLDGEFVTIFGDFYDAVSIAADEDGFLYVCDQECGTISVF